MANNYLQFSEQIEYISDEERDWLIEHIEEMNSDENEPQACQYSDELDHIWLYAEEFGCPERIADLVAAFQTTFKKSERWELSWAEYCSKLRLGEFSGGALVVEYGQVKICNPGLELSDWKPEKPY